MPRPNATAPAEPRCVAVELLQPMSLSRSLDDPTIARLQESIRQHGLLQPILVIESGGGYEIVSGNHRTEACRRNGETEIDAIVLPAGTSREDALAKSLHENHVRRDETLPDVMKRVHALASYHKCRFEEGARLAGVSRSTFSKIQTVLDKLGPRAMAMVAERKIGVSIAYEVAKRAVDHEQQVEWLAAHAAGDMRRDDILAATRPSGATPKRLKLALTIDSVRLQLTMPADSGYDDLHQVLGKLKSRLVSHAKQRHPLELLPKLLQSQAS
ncbi:putative chromosome-partitioning protein ParB [Posidoniimonas corsicana]|uniref:Putative chromosome-partitioning protein ParB n=1 Tax=Posidoniimonas corsicana TaxID=1938618 RepID=A0A5C5V993_9BACT|nr:ParB N-terminal domain-containing protein [Posidoniimonas corsicana]TWT35176.1 putative chromosome-partitioning protein ParB [Posidoniimonas corsicana]